MFHNIILVYLLIIGGFQYGRAQTACKNNRYNINQAADTSTCILWGNYNLKTFDDHGINFKSDCTFTLTTFKAGQSEFRIDIGGFNNICRRTTAGCHTFIQILYNEVYYKLGLNDEGTATFTTDAKSYPIPTELDGLRVHQPGSRVMVEFTKIGVVVKWNEKNVVEVTVQNDRGYETFGLCGNNDKCSSNDQMLVNQLFTPDLKKFLEEWQVDKQSCPSNIDVASPCKGNRARIQKAMDGCQVLHQARFTEARKVLHPDLYVEACIWNYCSCRAQKTMDCLCDTIDSFVKASNNAGGKGMVWRDDQVCPFDCPNGLTYFPCAPKGAGQTCTDLEAPDQGGPCEEGCFCPTNTYFFQGKCYLKKRCPCLFGGKVYQPGDTLQQRCHTCVCTDGKIVCPERPPCKKTARAVGDPHFTTFDGKRFDFMGKCSYYLVKGPGFSIESDHYVWEGGKFVKNYNSAGPSWIRKLTIRMGGTVVEFNAGLEVVVDNVQVTRFPHKAGRIVITKPSGSLVLAELPNDVDVQWDGYSSATLRVPDTLEGQIMGLLGTYTDDPNDDFMMPTGEIAGDANTFGNSWKSEYSCQDQVVETQHPCDANPAARPAAEKICSAIKGDLFKHCHIEDVDTVYENCIYDTCLCREDPNKCSCDNIEVAAEVCGRQGIVTNWRNSIPECRMPCPAGQVYQECGDSCARTCEDLSMRAQCVASCVEGCNCAPGTTMDESGKCIPIKDCKCRIDGIVYPPDFKYLKSDTELLTCQNARWTRSVPTGDQQQVIPAEDQLRDKCNAFEFAEYTPCRYPTPKTCQNMHIFEIVPIPNCEEGCECTEGFVLDAVNKACVRPDECPCFDKGVSYQEGKVVVMEGCNRCVCLPDGGWNCREEDCSRLCIENEVKQIDDCNTCRCKKAFWECTNHDCSQQCKPGETKQLDCNLCTCNNGFWTCTEAVCPDPTHECEPNSAKHEGCKVCTCDNGRWKCNEDNCAPKPTCDNEDDVKFEDYGKCVCKGGQWKCIKGQCDIWGDSHVKTFDGVRYDFQGDCSYTLVEGQVGFDKFSVSFENEICSQEGATCLKSFTVDITVRGVGETVTLIKKAELPNTKHLRHIIVTDHYLFTTIKIYDAGVNIFWDKNTWVYVKLDEAWQNRIKGLCGNFNRNKHDDLDGGQPTQGPHNPVLAYVDRWQTEAECGKTKPNINACNSTRLKWAEASCELMLGPVFAACHNLVPVKTYYEACVIDSCKCDLGGDCDCLCTDLAMYAQQCNNFGIQINWRSQKTCPIQCPSNTEYQTCVSPSCPPKTCETIRQNRTVNCEEEEELCFEGCGPKSLPLNKVYTDSEYDRFVDEEVCTKQRCKDYFYEGEVTLQKQCLICVCSFGEEKCMNLPCPDDKRQDNQTTPNPWKPTEDNRIEPGRTPTPYVIGTPDGRSTPSNSGSSTKPPIPYVQPTKEPGDNTDTTGRNLKPTPNPDVPGTKEPGVNTDATGKYMKTTPNPADESMPTVEPTQAVTPSTPEIIKYPPITTAKPTPPIPCNESACPLLQCPKITKEIQLPGQCCKMCQHETKCVVKMQHNNNLVLKKVGQKWTDGPCRECQCIGEEKYNHCASCRKKTCAIVNEKTATIGNTYYEFNRGQCCPVMEAVACIYGNKLYRIGELWDIDECTTAKCVKHSSNNLTTVVEMVEVCNENCPRGFVYKKSRGNCCGQCVQDSCMVGDEVKKPGDTWTSPDGCTNYTCVSAKGIYQIIKRKTICPPVQKCPGRVKKGRCCEYCETTELFYWEKEPSECEDDLIPEAV